MKLCRADDKGLYWFPDDGLPRVDRAISGPHESRQSAYLWLCAYLEERFTGARATLWSDAVAQLGERPDAAHLMGLAMMVASGQTREVVLRAARPIRDRYDAKARAAGERAA